MASDKTLYQILGVYPCATTEEIDIAYKDLARKKHPDAGGDTCEFQTIVEAGRILRNRASRLNYDGRLEMLREKCPECKGSGRRWKMKGFSDGQWIECSKCEGVGYA